MPVTCDATDFAYIKASTLSSNGRQFTDEFGRTLSLRGLNVGGDTKLPSSVSPDGKLSFVGRPFPLEEARERLEQMKACGVGMLRWLVTWEALEHRAPGIYDDDYITYLIAAWKIAKDLGLLVFIDIHQDVWGRHSGGSGAPEWTFELAGLDVTKLRETHAASLLSEEEKGELGVDAGPSGRLWPTNYSKFAVGTMFTLFFAGSTFAPSFEHTKFPGENIQDILQKYYIRALSHLARRLKKAKLTNVVGWDLMNEPHHGWIGLKDLRKYNEDKELHLGAMPTAVEGMYLAAGIPMSVPYYERSWPHPTRKTGTRLMNKECVSVWMEERKDIWRAERVWDVNGTGTPSLLKPTYFTKDPRTGAEIDFRRDFYAPFVQKLTTELRSILGPDTWIFLEPVPNESPKWIVPDEGLGKVCYAPHWYDLRVLFEKEFSPKVSFNVQALSNGSRNLLAHTYFGLNGLLKNYTTQFKTFVDDLRHFPINTPVLIGETGVPFDQNDRHGYKTGDWTLPSQQLEAMLGAMEKNLILNYTLWTYSAGNNGPETAGDKWNLEDLSLISQHSSVKDLNGGAHEGIYDNLRAADVFIRPYAPKVAGEVKAMSWDPKKKLFKLVFMPNVVKDEEDYGRRITEVFIPRIHFPKGLKLIERAGKEKKIVLEPEIKYGDITQDQTVYYMHEVGQDLVTLEFSDPEHEVEEKSAVSWTLVLTLILPLLVLLLALRSRD
ncbi:hypothetical protein YB2330_006268 [Saitoella coloradoensis]